uniref:Uncharacterized protein n=1 Tax=Pararge aegeria TaxID=116150 RepID=S4PSK4_9NEOP
MFSTFKGPDMYNLPNPITNLKRRISLFMPLQINPYHIMIKYPNNPVLCQLSFDYRPKSDSSEKGPYRVSHESGI